VLRNYLRGREVVAVRSKASGRQTATLDDCVDVKPCSLTTVLYAAG